MAEPVENMASGMPYLFTPAIYSDCEVSVKKSRKKKTKKLGKKYNDKQKKETDIRIGPALLTPISNLPFPVMATY